MAVAGEGSRIAAWASLVLVIGLVVVLSLSGTPISSQPDVLGMPTVTPTPTPTYTPTPTPTPTATPTWTPSPTPTSTPTQTPTPTLTPSPTPTWTPSPTPTPAPASAHLWLEKPLGPEAEGDRYPGTYFPYGATGEGRYHLHHGIDYMNPAGTPILATAPGKVIVSGNDLETVYGKKPDFYGNLVIQELDQQFEGQAVYVLYGHLQETLVEEGQHLDTGDVLGLVGMTGVAIGNHLHLEVRLGTNAYETSRNPVLWMKQEPGQGVISGLVLDSQGEPAPEVPVTFFRAAEPSKWWRQIQTYANSEVNSDDRLGENFAMGYVPAGDYLVKATIDGKDYVRPVTVEADEIAFVLVAPED